MVEVSRLLWAPMPHITELTPEVQDTLLRLAGKGLSYRMMADAVGVSVGMLSSWRRLGEDPANEYYYHFIVALKKCRAIGLESRMDSIIEAAPTDWRAAAWYLERVAHETFGPREKKKVELTGAKGGPVDIKINMGATVVGEAEE
jgi:hypothetical protein